jgi:hypothetical protein
MVDTSSFKIKLPKLFSYHNQIKSPEQAGASSAGSNAALQRDADAIFAYVGGIFSGNNNYIFKTGTPMLGDKQFFNTGGQCSKTTIKEIYNNNNVNNSTDISSVETNEDKLVDRYSYIDNITKTANNQPVGLLYQVIDDVMDLNPVEIFNSILEPPNPECIPVTLKTIKENFNYDIENGFETQYVILSEVEQINPCNFADGVNPLSKDKTNAVCDINNRNQVSLFESIDQDRKLSNTKENFSNIYNNNYSQDYLMQLYIFFVLILFFYLFYKLNYK